MLPVVVGVGASLLFFFLQKDLGPALFLSCVFLALYAVARARVGLALAGCALLAAGFYVGYRAEHLGDAGRARADVAVAVGQRGARRRSGRAGDLGAGHRRLVRHRPRPRRHALSAGRPHRPRAAALGEELGLVGLVAVVALYALIAWRGFRIALRAANDYGFFLATAVTLFLACRCW